jgi:opacity protein-like surface antigen
LPFNTDYLAAFSLSLEDDINDYVTLHFEAAKSYSDDNIELDYSFGLLGKIHPLGKNTLSPFLLLGASTTAVSYDYISINTTGIEIISDTQTSSGIQYGAGLEYAVVDDLKLSLTYEELPHIKYNTNVITFEVVIDL